ncbi:MAG: HD domain-containing protein [Planctomycetota bacterium]
MLPELQTLRQPASVVRLPSGQDVPLTQRVRRLLDTAPMRRLASISQLGMVPLVYPGATHSRMEHSLGVYHYALRLLDRFSDDPRFQDSTVAEEFLLAALLHDVGHWPYCHPIEDMQLPALGEHEDRAQLWMGSGDVAACLDQEWDADAGSVARLLTVKPSELSSETDPRSFARAFFASCLSGPIDVDKLDYLQRDSLHAGVPYGRNFDAQRLVHSTVVHPDRPALAISEKGRTAAEMMVFARYVMFSEVYWHHAVRSATAMLQRAVFLLQHRMDLESSVRFTDSEWIASIQRMAEGSVAEPLVEGLFGVRRVLHKRLAEFDVIDGADIHQKLSRRPYWWLVACAEKLAENFSRAARIPVHAADVLIDAPPIKLEVDINIDVVRRDGSVKPLGEMSPVASALANQQFDQHVKRVRVFVRGDLRDALRAHFQSNEDVAEALCRSIESIEEESS